MKVGICSLGCKVNIYESEYVENLLKNHGYEIVSFEDEADIYIINTCSVTNESDRKSRKMIHQAKRRNDQAIIIVMGCYSQVKSDEIDADIILGNKDKSRIVEYIEEYLDNHLAIKKIYDLRKVNDFEAMNITSFDNHTRAFVKIQDGCNAFCSYCIIPYTRGIIRSKKFDDVVMEVTNLVKNGYQEIVLTGIHTGKYGMDLENMNLEKLLRRLVKIPGIYRIRLSSIEINEITSGILDLIQNSKVIARHFHIPLQSGSERILKLMNRRYDLTYFKEFVQKIRSLDSDISITTDLIVGFPGETDLDFQETIKTLEEIHFTKIHTFPYSPREGTPASKMDNQVDGITKKKRVKQILQMSFEQEREFYQKYVGKVLDGLTEVRRDGKVVVLTSNYISVFVDGSYQSNQIVSVLIERVDNDNKVYGKVV
ncbi:MAG: tRNA (N(6)-L-threonylcarbamoyladenosine(37)-C(2))-methylthiotransferase MtaB [Erysipelotrichaceae bacterium]|nr:tRNA (N(6)-L-threonylcarbamoyladenosine(37)-C(2))-methylthiotransferase MtaB [Erysipelotrichaceae bacterium]